MAAKADAVILALTGLWQAATATTLAGVKVADGPQVNSDPSPAWLFVGSDGGEPSEFMESANAQQSWLAFNKIKREDGSVTCAAVVVQGGTDVPTVRAAAYGVVSAAEDVLRTDPMLGGAVSLQAYLSSHQLFVKQTNDGVVARVVFTVTYQAQI